MPRLVILNVAVVGVVGAVADAPAVVGHQDGRVHDVADEVVQGAVVGEALVAAKEAEMQVGRHILSAALEQDVHVLLGQ